MDEAIELLRTFVQRDYEANVARHKERDRDAFQKKVARAGELFGPGLVPLVDRPLVMSDEKWAAWSAQGDDIVPRPLFMVKAYDHSKRGRIYRGYLGYGERYESGTGYDQSVYVAKRKGKKGLEIISFQNACGFCQATGKTGKRACDECGGTGWKHHDGAVIEKPGKLVEVRKLEAPTDPVYRAQYERD
jgi:hypothetical protein